MEFPIGVSDFKKLIDGKYLFADKSLFVKDIMEDGSEVIVLTRPRRFGKTLNLSMLYYFLRHSHSSNLNLFDGLNISKDTDFCKAHQQQYPVIFITFKDIKKLDYPAAYAGIVGLISALYEEHIYLLEGDCLSESQKNRFMALLNEEASPTHIESAIKQLSEYMTKKFNQPPIILIDEYDTPIQEAYLHEYYVQMMGLMRGILGQALKDNKFLGKAIITGITRIAQESLFSGVNNIKVYSVLQGKYGQYFGFTEKEVLKLLAESKQEAPIEAIKEWYNGYQIGQYTLYNPWSIINCLDNSEPLQPFWVNTASNDLIARLLGKASPAVKQQFEQLLQGNVIEQPISENLLFLDIEKSEEALWSLLLYAGYLKVLSSELRGYRLMAKLAIPNKEVGFVYDKVVDAWFSTPFGFDSYDGFKQSLANGDMGKFKDYLSTYIMKSGSYFDFNSNTPEQVFHAFILGLVVGLRDHYHISSNKESGLGRLDIVFIPKEKHRKGILLEFKTSTTPDLLLKKAQEALEQIKNKRYIDVFNEHGVHSVLTIGLAFCGKEVELVHEDIVI